MGHDIRTTTPRTLSILSNPAIIAISQDPLGSSAVRRWLYNIPASSSSSSPPSTWPSDPHASIPSIQLWTGALAPTTSTAPKTNDALVLLINGGPTPLTLHASLADIFFDSGPAGTAPQIGLAWELRDLWADRMSDAEAGWIIGNVTDADNKTMGDFAGVVAGRDRFNVSRTGYAEALAKADDRVLGSVTSTVMPRGTVSAVVEGHGVRVFRLRAVGEKGAEL